MWSHRIQTHVLNLPYSYCCCSELTPFTLNPNLVATLTKPVAVFLCKRPSIHPRWLGLVAVRLFSLLQPDGGHTTCNVWLQCLWAQNHNYMFTQQTQICPNSNMAFGDDTSKIQIVPDTEQQVELGVETQSCQYGGKKVPKLCRKLSNVYIYWISNSDRYVKVSRVKQLVEKGVKTFVKISYLHTACRTGPTPNFADMQPVSDFF